MAGQATVLKREGNGYVSIEGSYRDNPVQDAHTAVNVNVTAYEPHTSDQGGHEWNISDDGSLHRGVRRGVFEHKQTFVLL